MSLFGIIRNRLFVKKINLTTTITVLSENSMLSGKTALVTGGASGFGYAIAKQFLISGAKVIITGRNLNKLQDAQKKLNSNKVSIAVIDQSDFSNIRSSLASLTELHKIDIFVNNAGVGWKKNWNDFDVRESEYDNVINTNLKGFWIMCQAEVNYFINNGLKGKIINISSDAAISSSVNPYTISKWGVNCLTKGYAQCLASKGIVVNAIAPGTALTDMESELRDKVGSNSYSNENKMKRIVQIEEIANIALFLASDQANCIIGQVIVADGGKTLI